jgi:hypothetical protein
MNHERRILLDGCADGVWKAGLGEGHGNAAVGDVASGAEQSLIGERGQQFVQIGFSIEIERWRLAPEAA